MGADAVLWRWQEPDSGDTFSMHSMLQLALREYAMRSAARRLSADHKPSPVPPLPKACHDVLVLLVLSATCPLCQAMRGSEHRVVVPGRGR